MEGRKSVDENIKNIGTILRKSQRKLEEANSKEEMLKKSNEDIQQKNEMQKTFLNLAINRTINGIFGIPQDKNKDSVNNTLNNLL